MLFRSFAIAGLTSAIVSAFPARSALPMALVIATVELVALFCFQVIALRALQPGPAGTRHIH